MLKVSAYNPIISRDAALAILDLIEKVRRNNQVCKLNNGFEDVYIRLVAGIVADAGGFKTREDWELALKDIPDSYYAKDYENPDFAGTF